MFMRDLQQRCEWSGQGRGGVRGRELGRSVTGKSMVKQHVHCRNASIFDVCTCVQGISICLFRPLENELYPKETAILRVIQNTFPHKGYSGLGACEESLDSLTEMNNDYCYLGKFDVVIDC